MLGTSVAVSPLLLLLSLVTSSSSAESAEKKFCGTYSKRGKFRADPRICVVNFAVNPPPPPTITQGTKHRLPVMLCLGWSVSRERERGPQRAVCVRGPGGDRRAVRSGRIRGLQCGGGGGRQTTSCAWGLGGRPSGRPVHLSCCHAGAHGILQVFRGGCSMNEGWMVTVQYREGGMGGGGG